MPKSSKTGKRYPVALMTYIDPELHARLTELAEESDRSLSSVIRLAIAAYIDLYGAFDRRVTEETLSILRDDS